MTNQKEKFFAGEADAWYERNAAEIQKRSNLNNQDYPILSKLKELEITPKRILEIGCSNGYRLQALQQEFGAECYGVDPSNKAIKEGSKLYPKLHLIEIDAAGMAFEKDFFDLIIFGFSLTLCDRDDLFKISYLADNSLSDQGHIIIQDFYSDIPYRNPWIHKEGLYAYKMRYVDLFLCHPYYKLLLEQIYNASAKTWKSGDMDDMSALSILKKMKDNAFIDNPYTR